MSSIANTIAGQLHHTKPDHLVPGQDVGMEPKGPLGLRVVIFFPDRSIDREAVIEYDEGMDLYNVTMQDAGDDKVTAEGIYFDQLGPMIWGDRAKAWTAPAVTITTWDDDGNPHEEVIA